MVSGSKASADCNGVLSPGSEFACSFHICILEETKLINVFSQHMIDDGSRGYILELMATKLLCLDEQVQVVGMSATLNACLHFRLLYFLLTLHRTRNCSPSG